MIIVLKNVEHEGPGLIDSFFAAKGYEVRIIELSEGDLLPRKYDQIDAMFVMGGPMNVYEKNKYPFLQKEEAFVKKAVELGVPVMGVCLGAQLMAKAFGAKVLKASEKEIGWGFVELNETGKSDKLFAGLGEELAVFQWHEDMFEVPGLGVLLGRSEICNQVFKLGERSFALQFHIEVTPDIISSWVRNTREISKDDIKVIKSKTKEIYSLYKLQAEKILSNYLEIIRSQ